MPAPALFDPSTATITDLQKLLERGTSSNKLVEVYLGQIARHNDRLNSVWSLTPTEVLQTIASRLDKERAEGHVRGPLHGIPVLIKDNTATDTSYELDTTGGSLALVGATSVNSDLVDKLEAAGAILLGKTTLSELNYWKGNGLVWGWSAVAGQAQSAYVRGGVDPEDTPGGHSNPGGSSTGSAISVSAGFAPIAYGSETDGSVIIPANRAGIYSIKPTVGICSARGMIPIDPLFDTPGVMGKCAIEVGLGLDAIVIEESHGRYAEAASNESWGDLRLGLLDPEHWQQSPTVIKPVKSATEQMIEEINLAYDKLETVVKTVHRNLDWLTASGASEAGKYLKPLWRHTFKPAFEDYLSTLKDTKVHTLADLIQFNIDHKDRELPAENPNQDALVASIDSKLSDEQAAEYLDLTRKMGRAEGIDKALAKYNIDAIIAPADSPVGTLASASGYPIVTLPLSHLYYNGRPFGLVALASAGQDEVLLRVMAAWQASFPQARKSPPLLSKESDGQIQVRHLT